MIVYPRSKKNDLASLLSKYPGETVSMGRMFYYKGENYCEVRTSCIEILREIQSLFPINEDPTIRAM